MKFQKGIEWTSLLANITPLMLMLNFLDEIKETKREDISIVYPSYVTNVLGITCLIIFGLSFAFGLSIAGESSKHLYWQNKNAEETAKFVQLGEERSFKNAKGQILKYLLIMPTDYDSTKKYPLVVSLPYGGYEAPAAQLLAESSMAHRYPAFLFVPFCPQGAGWGGIPNYPTIDTLVFDAILKLEEEVSIDENRRYVTGISRGGYGSWHFISMRPDMFAAAIPVCGGGNPQLASGIVDVSVWAFHGALDRNVPVSGSRDMIEAMKKAGSDPKYTEFSDKAHNIWYEVTQTPGLWDWLFEQEREPVTIAK
jgi:predicted peptidase